MTADVKSWLSMVTIRTVQAADLPGLEWDGQYVHYRRVYADAFERAQTGRSVLWIADLPHVGIIGQVFIQLICDRPELANGADRAYLYAFRVRPEFRSQGLGGRMMQIVDTDLIRRGFHWVTLNVAQENRRARQLYERAGYRVVAPEPGVWSYPDHVGVWHTVEEPAWRMEKRING
ncbi:MAG TPA: GNAT family N-acetyltransferase [Anaerolineaceae bacterium]|jgi:ribosomal protein S18 acetylase RimI-like enzyme